MKIAVLVYAVVSLVTLAAFGFDKWRARRGGRRVPESTLHLLELIGGWPGALIAMQLFHHKRSKPRYVLVVAVIALLHVVILVWATWFRGP